MSSKYGCALGSSRPMNRSSIHRPPYSPGGREMLWITRSEICSPSGRSSQWGDMKLVSGTHFEIGVRYTFRAEAPASRRIRNVYLTPISSVDPQPIQAVAQGPEGDAQKLRGGGLVEARRLERLGDGLALDLVEEVVQRQAACAERAVQRRDLVLGGGLGEVEVALEDLVVGAERQRAL